MDTEAPKGCHQRNIRDSLKGAGPCAIRADIKLRSGKPNWWCFTHGMEASAPDGSAVESCEASWFDPVPEELRASFDLGTGQIAVWGDLPPTLKFGSIPKSEGKVHVHLRRDGQHEKDVDRSFDIVTLQNGAQEMVIEGMAAVAFSTSVLAAEQTKVLACTQCGELHIDEARFATRPHRKHLCNSCGRNFNDPDGPSIANPLANISTQLGLGVGPGVTNIDRPLAIETSDFSGVALWPSNQAIVSTMERPEELGIHVHAWDTEGDMVIDETYSQVVCDDQVISRELLVLLTLQRSAAPDSPVMAVQCATCTEPIVDAIEDDWIAGCTRHVCGACQQVTRTRLKVLSNPLAYLLSK